MHKTMTGILTMNSEPSDIDQDALGSSVQNVLFVIRLLFQEKEKQKFKN